MFLLFFGFFFPPLLFWAGSVLCLRLWIWSLFFLWKEDWPCGTGQWQNKGYSLYLYQVLTELKTGKRNVDILGSKLKGERNAMFIVALYLVIKEHKICLSFFLCEHSLVISPPLFYCYLLFFCCWCLESGTSCNSPTSIHFTFLASLLSIYIHPSTLFLRHQTFSVTYSFFVSLWRLCCPNMDTNVGDYFDGEVLRGWTSTRLCSRANRTLSSLCYNFVRNVYIFFLCIT